MGEVPPPGDHQEFLALGGHPGGRGHLLAIPVWGDLRPGQPSPYNTLPWLTLALVAVGVIYPFVLNARRPDVLDRAPALLEGEESTAVDPLPIGE